MKPLFFIIFIIFSCHCIAQEAFDKYFTDKTLRIDYIHAGDSVNEHFFFKMLKQEPFWGGPRKNLIDRFDYGEYKTLVFEESTNTLIYSRGFCTLFEEWITTSEASSVAKSFYETQVIPFPKMNVRIEIHGRNDKNKFEKLFEHNVDPKDYFIETSKTDTYKVYDIHVSGESHNKVDIVFIPDGYTIEELDKFKKDAEKMGNSLLDAAPFNENKDKFNIRAVLAPSDETGTDIPGKGEWHKTVVESSFYTFDSERYLMTEDIKAVRNIAAHVPYDQIYILVNSDKYGGGAIYNYYSMSSVDNMASKFVVAHEFGHNFAGLGDEYYTSQVSYSDFFDLELEPWQPNITTLKDFDNKWKSMLDDTTPIPTPPTKEYKDNLGVFEGGGYVAKGVYRPAYICTMKSNTPKGFCPVCRKAIVDMIVFLCDE